MYSQDVMFGADVDDEDEDEEQSQPEVMFTERGTELEDFDPAEDMEQHMMLLHSIAKNYIVRYANSWRLKFEEEQEDFENMNTKIQSGGAVYKSVQEGLAKKEELFSVLQDRADDEDIEVQGVYRELSKVCKKMSKAAADYVSCGKILKELKTKYRDVYDRDYKINTLQTFDKLDVMYSYRRLGTSIGECIGNIERYEELKELLPMRQEALDKALQFIDDYNEHIKQKQREEDAERARQRKIHRQKVAMALGKGGSAKKKPKYN